MSDLDISFDDLAVDGSDPPLSPEEYLQQLTDDCKREEEEYLNTLSRYERERFLQKRAEEDCRRACRQLKDLRQERRTLLWSALYKPIFMPVSLIGAGIAGAVAQGNIGLLAAGTGIAADIGIAGWWLRKTIRRYPILRNQIQQCEETIREYQEKYWSEARMLLMEENIDI